MNALYDIVGIPFGYLMRLIYSICSNYAVSIIIFTVVTKLILFPVNYKTQKSAARMQLLNPKLEKLRKSFGSNPQRLQEEQQKLYAQEGVNPMASCMPALIQMILLFGVIDVVYKPITHILGITKPVRTKAAEITSSLASELGINGGKAFQSNNLRSELFTMEALEKKSDSFSSLAENFASKVRDLSENFTIFGANLGKTPTLHPDSWTNEAKILVLIPFLAGLAQLIFSFYSQIHQKKVSQTPVQGGGCMAVMMYGMPLLSIWFAFQVPAGVGFYWIWSSLFSFVITFALNQYFTPERTAAIAEKEKEKARIYAEKHPEKKTFMQKVLEQQQAAMEQQNAANRSNGGKLSRSEQNKYNRDAIKDARKRMAEKYGDDYDENDDDE